MQDVINTIDKARKTIFGYTKDDCNNLLIMLEKLQQTFPDLYFNYDKDKDDKLQHFYL